MRRLILASALSLVACVDDLPEPWDLDYTRIVAIRAEPPGILAGETSRLEGLLAFEGGPTVVAPPEGALVVSPMSLAAAVSFDGTTWVVTAPDEATIQAARVELALDPGAAVPLQVGVSYNGMDKIALKTIVLGEARANPSLASATIDGALLADQAELVFDADAETRFAIDAVLEDDVNWLTSCGTMRDFDLPASAYVTIEDDDIVDMRLVGELALVFRDPHGGVSWRVWPARAE